MLIIDVQYYVLMFSDIFLTFYYIVLVSGLRTLHTDPHTTCVCVCVPTKIHMLSEDNRNIKVAFITTCILVFKSVLEVLHLVFHKPFIGLTNTFVFSPSDRSHPP